MRRARHSRERGQALIIAALAMTALLGIVGLVTDVGLAFLEKSHMQKGVDAAAIAGAQLLPENPPAAQQAARDIAVANGLDLSDVTIEISGRSYPNDTISVRATGDVPAYFSRVLNFVQFDISVKAAARSGSPTAFNEIMPLAVEWSAFNGLHTGDRATLKYDSLNQVTGNSLALALPGDSGANDFRSAVANGSAQTLCMAGQEYSGCTSIVSTEPGQMIGPLQQGLRTRFQATSSACDDFREVITTDTLDPAESMIDTDCHPYAPYNVASSRRIVLVPVINHLCNGSCDVQIVDFALFFVNDVTCTNESGHGQGQGQGQGICTVTGVYAERVSNVRHYSKLGPYNGSSVGFVAALIE